MTPAPSNTNQPLEPPAPWSVAGWVVVVAALLIGFTNYPLRVLGGHLDSLPGDAGDNRLNNYILEHGYRCLTGQSRSLAVVEME